MQRRHELACDRAFGISTHASRRYTNLDPDAASAPYEPFGYPALRMLSTRLKLSEDDVVYDLGCGKGRVVCFFARERIRQCIGVELSAELAAEADLNAQKLLGRQARIAIHSADAAALSYDDASVVFMYNPFGAGTMSEVLAKLQGRAGLRIIYAAPVHEAIFAEFPDFQPIDRFAAPHDLGKITVAVYQHL
jgi:precorrin-6B methylase 2